MMTQDRSTGQPLAAPTSLQNSASSSTDLQSSDAPQVSPRNLNPAAPVFHQSAPTSPKNLNPSAPVFCQSQSMIDTTGQGTGNSDDGAGGDGEGDPAQLLNGGMDGLLLEDLANVEDAAPVVVDGGEDASVDSGGGGGGAGSEMESEEQQQQAGQGGHKFPQELLAPVTKQMHYYFSQENLPSDKFLNGHMDSDKYIPLDIFLDFGRIKPICSSMEMLIQAVEASSVLELNEGRDRVRVSQCRKTLTLRGFPGNPPVTEEEVKQFVMDMGAEVPTHIELVMVKDNQSTWYVSFKDMTAARDSFFMFHKKTAVFKGHTIGCCMKSSGTLGSSSYYPTPAPAAGQAEDHTHHQHHPHHQPQQRRMVVGGVVPPSAQNSVISTGAPVVPSTPSPLPQQQHQQQQQQQQQHQQQLQQQAVAAAAAALLPQYQAMQLHPSFGSPGIYYPQASSYMQYMPSMLAAQGWPSAAAMDPGIIMQSQGLQPQQIRSTPMPRQHLMPAGTGGPQHRFTRPQRGMNRANSSGGSNVSDRGSDRQAPVVSVAGLGGARSSPSTTASYMHHGGHHQHQHHQHHHHHQHQQQQPHHRPGTNGNLREDVASAVMTVSAVPQVVSGQQQQQPQFVSPLVTQHQHQLQQQQQQPHATTTATTAALDVSLAPYQHHHSNQHPGNSNSAGNGGGQALMVQAAQQAAAASSSANASNGGSGNNAVQHQLQPHHVQPHPHHHHQPPPPLPLHQHQQNQQHSQSAPQHHHQNPHHQHHGNHHSHHHHHHQPQQQQQHHHHQSPHMAHNQPPPSQQGHNIHHHHHHQQHHHQQQQQQPHHNHHQQQQQHHNMLQQPPPHHHPQHHQQMPPPHPPPHHQHQQHHQQQQHQALPPGRSDRNKRRGRREDIPRHPRGGGERPQSNRANFSSQVPPVTDNFTMEANSFPPLPGAASNVANSEVSHENRLSDVVRGNRPRLTGNVIASAGNNASGPRAPSSTPSPVATPNPNLIATGQSSLQHPSNTHQRGQGGQQQAESFISGSQEDTVSASSQEDNPAEVESAGGNRPVDIASASQVSAAAGGNGGGRAESSQNSEAQSQVASRSQKAGTPTSSAVPAAGGRPSDLRQGPVPSSLTNHQGRSGPVTASPSALLSPTATASASEAPKLSYAQIAQKNPEAAYNAAGLTSAGDVGVSGQAMQSALSNTSTSSTSAASTTTMASMQNGPGSSVSSHASGNTAARFNMNSNNSGGYAPNAGYSRDQQNQVASGYRQAPHRGGGGGQPVSVGKDALNFTVSGGSGAPQYQRASTNSINSSTFHTNNRRNPKDKIGVPNNVNKYERRKPETRQK